MADKYWERRALLGGQSFADRLGGIIAGLMLGATAVGTIWSVWYLWF